MLAVRSLLARAEAKLLRLRDLSALAFELRALARLDDDADALRALEYFSEVPLLFSSAVNVSRAALAFAPRRQCRFARGRGTQSSSSWRVRGVERHTLSRACCPARATTTAHGALLERRIAHGRRRCSLGLSAAGQALQDKEKAGNRAGLLAGILRRVAFGKKQASAAAAPPPPPAAAAAAAEGGAGADEEDDDEDDGDGAAVEEDEATAAADGGGGDGGGGGAAKESVRARKRREEEEMRKASRRRRRFCPVGFVRFFHALAPSPREGRRRGR